jgi:hypothetical protein
MATALHGWLRRDMEEHRIAPSEVVEASLDVEFSTERYGAQRDRQTSYARPPEAFVGCRVRCQSLVRSADRSYTATLDDVLEWGIPLQTY